MEVAVLVITHIMLLGVGFAFGHIKGYSDAQPKRDAKGRYTKAG